MLPIQSYIMPKFNWNMNSEACLMNKYERCKQHENFQKKAKEHIP